jgi:hypothetical protein
VERPPEDEEEGGGELLELDEDVAAEEGKDDAALAYEDAVERADDEIPEELATPLGVVLARRGSGIAILFLTLMMCIPAVAEDAKDALMFLKRFP